jgi:hypothetical protein
MRITLIGKSLLSLMSLAVMQQASLIMSLPMAGQKEHKGKQGILPRKFE